ncbi:MAG: glycoside hydrolase family 16 protein [Bacteroidaceae bacterium]|nr:glycoside hydrolase family 16 protein [Bacteroidaceae bacterium]
MKSVIIPVLLTLSAILPINASAQNDGWHLVWQDEFDADGRPDSTKWTYEHGFERNEELQWYTRENAYQRDGHLVIEARPANFACPSYKEGNTHWRNNRPRILWTSSCVKTRGLFSFLFGRVEVRARIPVCLGAWPAIWLLGDRGGWPGCGEIDMMEYYQYDGRPTVLANACWAGDKDTQWDNSFTPLTHFTDRDPAWAERFHVWRMDWNESAIRLYLDDELLNEIDLSLTVNGKLQGTGVNPFHHPQYLLLNLALDTRVRQYNPADFPMRYEIDYVRVFQKE